MKVVRKLIFESEEEKEFTINDACPYEFYMDLGWNCNTEGCDPEDVCKRCWENCGIELEVSPN